MGMGRGRERGRTFDKSVGGLGDQRGLKSPTPVGDAYDNAMCESFLASLECELLQRTKLKTQTEARMAVFRTSRAGTTRDGASRVSTTTHPSYPFGLTRR